MESYKMDCDEKNPTATGIKEVCVFNQVEGFHVCKNITLDLMHDLFEGAANSTMVKICEDLIYNQKLFSLKFLNERLSSFDYGQADISNAIPIIKSDHILKKKNLKMSSAEMICFTRFFGLLIGDKVKYENDTWKLYILLRKIIAIVTSPRMVQGHILMLEVFIYDFLVLYQTMYGDLKYKLHNMIHLPRALEQNGPLVHYWSMRPESKHRQLKLSSATTNNRINLLKTISLKSQLRLAYLKHTKEIRPNLVFDLFVNIEEYDRQKYFSKCKKDEIILSVKHAEYMGIKYNIGMVFVMEINDAENVTFGKIIQIFVQNNNLILLMQRLISTYFDEHYFAYNVEEYETYTLKNAKELPSIHPCVIIKREKELLVASKYIL